MFPYDSRDQPHPRKRKFFQVGNTSTRPFGLNVDFDAFHGRAVPNASLYPTDNNKNMLDTPIKPFTCLLLNSIGEDMPLDALMGSDHKTNPHDWKNETYGLWSFAISQGEEKLKEKDAQMHKLSRDLYEKTRQLVKCELDNMVLKKKRKMAVEKIKSFRKTLKEVISRPGEGQEDQGESSFVGTKRHEAAWLRCKVCDTRMANMIMCPCKHMSVCRRCDDTITMCPVCKAAKISSVEVCLT